MSCSRQANLNSIIVTRVASHLTRSDTPSIKKNTKKNMTKNMNFIWLHNKKIYNSGYSTEIVNEQCNTGDPLETSGGLYRGPPSMLMYVNTIKCCACETLNLVHCSITMNVKLLQ